MFDYSYAPHGNRWCICIDISNLKLLNVKIVQDNYLFIIYPKIELYVIRSYNIRNNYLFNSLSKN